MKKSSFAIVAAVALAFIASGCIKWQATPASQNPVLDLKADPAAPLEVGFAAEKITPSGSVYLAGFGGNRKSLGVHDDLFVRALFLRQGKVKILLAAFDLVGMQGENVTALKAAVKNLDPRQIIVCFTHNHSGPDVMGLWGPVEFTSGIDPRYLRLLGEKLAAAAARAESSAQPASVFSAVFAMTPEVMFNARRGEPEDETMGLIAFRDAGGGTIATLINAAGHAETMWADNRYITSDYPGRVCRLAEEKFGGGAIFINGATGAMITPNLPQDSLGHGWVTLERVSRSVFADVERGAGLLQPEPAPALRLRRATILCPAKNPVFIMGATVGILRRPVHPGFQISAGVSVLDIGQIQAVTFPGEVYPKLGMAVRKRQKPLSFQFGLADDELGYIIYPEDAARNLYAYESMVCVNPELSWKIEQTLAALLTAE